MKTLLAATAMAAGLALAGAQAHAMTNLVQNGSFETGDFTDWTQFGNTGFTGVNNGCFDDGCPTNGADLADFGPVGSTGGITQDLGTIHGFFDVFFDLSNDSGEFFRADLGSVDLICCDVPSPTGMTTYSFHHVAANGPTALTFTFQNSPAWYDLDNVRVTESLGVPEPAAWALMICGFGLAGATLRRRAAALA